MTYTIELATVDDAAGIAKVMLCTTEREFSRLQRGSMPDEDSQARMTVRFRAVIEDPKQKVIIARARDTGEIASVAQWVLHEDETATAADYILRRDRQIEQRRKTLDPRMNVDYIMEIVEKLGGLEYEMFRGQGHLTLENLATLPQHRKQGLAGKLVEWPLYKADQDGTLCFLTTDDGGSGESLYRKHGFERIGQVEFDLTRYGGSGAQTHIGMVRTPRSS